MEPLTRRRLLLLAFAFCWIAAVLVAGGPAVLAQRALDQHVAAAVAVQLLGSAALAALLAEFLRGVFSGGRAWTERRHFTIMGVLWAVLAVFSVLLVLSPPARCRVGGGARPSQGDDLRTDRTLRIDGATGEGGGQVLRTALSLSLITRTPIEISNIRARRSKPGLRPQHLRAVEAAAEVGQARMEGNRIGSVALYFRPERVVPGRYRFDIGTAGATSLVLQTVYLPLALLGAPSTVRITGGTHVPLSPCFHYLDLSWRWYLARAGIALALTMERAGFYPPGGGIVHAAIESPARVRPLHLQRRGALRGVRGVSAGARLPAHVAERQRAQARARLAERGVRADIEIERLDAPSPGSMLLLLAEFEHARVCYFALGERGKPAERVADEAADALLAFLETDAVVDEYLADQLLLPLAFAERDSILAPRRITEHLRTNAEIIRLFLPIDFDITGDRDAPGTVHIRPRRAST